MAVDFISALTPVPLPPPLGTASILVAAGHLGAHCYGVEIDPRVLRGREEGKNVYSNFKQYNLAKPEFLRGDMARRFFWRSPGVGLGAAMGLLDAVTVYTCKHLTTA